MGKGNKTFLLLVAFMLVSATSFLLGMIYAIKDIEKSVSEILREGKTDYKPIEEPESTKIQVFSSTIVPTKLHYTIYALVFAESDGRHKGLTSRDGARGYAQVRKCTWIDACKYLGLKGYGWSYQPNVWVREKNILMGTAYICWLYDLWYKDGYRGEALTEKVINSYSAGRSKIKRGYMYKETRGHYNRFLGYRSTLSTFTEWLDTDIARYIDEAIELIKKKKELKWESSL